APQTDQSGRLCFPSAWVEPPPGNDLAVRGFAFAGSWMARWIRYQDPRQLTSGTTRDFARQNDIFGNASASDRLRISTFFDLKDLPSDNFVLFAKRGRLTAGGAARVSEPMRHEKRSNKNVVQRSDATFVSPLCALSCPVVRT